MAPNSPNWTEISSKLPTGTDAAAKQTRNKLWQQLDMNGNGLISLAEVDRLMVVLQLGDLVGAKPVLLRAFNAAKGVKKSRSKLGDDYVEKREFRELLVNLRYYMELFTMFQAVDANGDGRLDFAEFERAVPLLQSWGAPLNNPRAGFDAIDADGHGMILFDEFSSWALRLAAEGRELDLPDDDENAPPPKPPPVSASPRRSVSPSPLRACTPGSPRGQLTPRGSTNTNSQIGEQRRGGSPVWARPSSPRCASPSPRCASPSPRCSSPRRTPRGTVVCEEAFAISDELYDALVGRSTPLPLHGGEHKRYAASRSLLLACHAATHGGADCVAVRRGGMLTAEQRDKALVELWRKLTSDEATAASELLHEAQIAHKKALQVRTPSPSYRRWLATSPSAGSAKAGFGSTQSQRAHPGIKVGNYTDTSIEGPGVGAYNPQEIRSQASKGSSWSRVSTTTSRLKKGSGAGDENDGQEGGRRCMLNDEWDSAERCSPSVGHYHTSSRNMAKQLEKNKGKASPGMMRGQSPSRIAPLKAARAAVVGPGSYDTGGFNMSRNDRARPSGAFASRVPRTSPFGGAPLVANMGALDGAGGTPRSPTVRGGRGL